MKRFEMNRNVVRFGLSPNEEAQLIQEECQRRRKLRIQQVRQQQRKIALQIRREVELRRGCELAQLEEELRGKWEQQQQEKFCTLQRLYHENLQLLGQGHRSAKENEPDLAAQAQKQEENQVKAEERYREALKEVKSQKLKDHEKQNRSINARKKALQAEKKRATMVARLPPPPRNPVQNIDSTQPHVVKKSDVSAFAMTHYHMPETTVHRVVDIQQIDAHVEATLELRKLEDLKEKAEREKEEQAEKACVRGKQALRKEQLMQDRECLLVELEHMQQTHMLKRRQRVSHMPLQTFQPYSKRQEMREEFQRELEFAFEDMYTGERRVKGDLVLHLVPEALPAASTSSHNQELDVPVEDVVAPTTENVQNGVQQERKSSDQAQSVQVQPFRPRPQQTLKKLFDRIRSQRNQWSSDSTPVPEPEVESVIADHIPERDTTIDTGSLTNEERDVPPPVEVPESFHLAGASEAPEHLAVTDYTHPPDEFERKIQEYEEHRKKRDEELEREKQQQILLLCELEDQKAKLEQMLLEAQQEGGHLKAVVSHDEHLPEEDVSSVTLVGAHQSAPPAGEDDHNRKIREYQRQLLEQDRIHQRSVEVARQRLDEYQKTLRLRYMMATSSLPAAVPSDVSHTPLVCTECDNLLPPPHLPTSYAAPVYTNNARAELHTPVDVPTREPAVAESPPDHSGSSVSHDSRLVSHELDSVAESPGHHSPDVIAQLSRDVMGEVREHLSEELQPYSGSIGYKLHKQCSTPQANTGVHFQPSYDAIQNTRYDECQLPGQTVVKPVTVTPSSLQAGFSGLTGEDMERQRHELQEVQRWVLEQINTIALHQRRKEEERQNLKMAQMKRQKEALQALISSDVQSTPEGGSKESVSLESSQNRGRILASLLKAIEESNGGTLSHFRNDHDDASDQQPSTSDSTSWNHTSAGLAQVSLIPSSVQVTKPPVTRVRMYMKEILAQHELSVIQEVDTPINTSLITGLEDNVTMLPQTVDWTPLEDKESSVSSDGTVHTSSLSSRGEQSTERASTSGTSSRRSSLLHWRERVLMGAGSPDSGLDRPGLRIVSPLSESGQQAKSSGSARCLIERVSGLSDPDWFSSTTISTGSYVTTDPEHNYSRTDQSPSVRGDLEEQREHLPDVSSPSEHGSCNKDSVSSGHSVPAASAIFDSSTIQRIIDKYTKELTISLGAIGTTTGGGSHGVQPGSSFSHQASTPVLERRTEEEPGESFSPHPSTALHDTDTMVQPSFGHFTDEGLSPSEDKNSFRPLIGHLADQSTYLPEEQRTSAMEHLVGHPSAHSSMIAHRPGQTASVSLDQSGWDSTRCMIGRLSNHSSSRWLRISQDVHPGRTGQMELEQSSMCLDEGHEENQMRPLLGEVDESVGQQSESLGEMTYVDLGVSQPLLPAEVHSHSVSVPFVSPLPQDQMVQSQITSAAQDSDRTQFSDSFHPLLAEVTHNETTDPP
ncbi:centrosomal protein of 295 kDa isoform X2 [Thalassophryne amazonica]|uniref:centrosomal protein of 295 kDa isoform X2 n=1 Tax=Thalassophryne amazonica TaxID=390379 RepID=UPI0014713568|nr:centrosomal protein of 295 kDa isoform X2 [Thalassophryne amazonica]